MYLLVGERFIEYEVRNSILGPYYTSLVLGAQGDNIVHTDIFVLSWHNNSTEATIFGGQGGQ